MKWIERWSGVFLIAGLALFFGATLSLGIVPALMTQGMKPNQGLPDEIPMEFTSYYDSLDKYHAALKRGRDLYIREACWHCHSQYVRPVSGESQMYGPVSTPGEYQTVLHLPQLFGTRRVGPDLSREAGKKSNDWHFAHLYSPTSVVPESVMPSYPWYFEKKENGEIVPTADGVALVAYLQNLGAEFANRVEYAWEDGQFIEPPEE